MDKVKLAIVGAGPYGLSIAAHLRGRGIEFRIFGKPMQSWRSCMPAGMFLKSEGFASDLYDPGRRFTLERFCTERQLPFQAIGVPVPIGTFTEYGLAFQQKLVPNLEEKEVVGLEQTNGGFSLQLEDGELVRARKVVLATGITHFPHISSGLAHLPPEVVSHSSEHRDVGGFRGRRVSVVGGGASALDLAAALHESGAEVHLIARRSRLKFNAPVPPSPWKKWPPRSRLGGGWRSHFFEQAPMMFRHLPLAARTSIVRNAFGPAAGSPVKARVEGLPLFLGHTVQHAKCNGAGVELRLLGPDGDESTLTTDHVIAATGYRVDLRRVRFLSKDLRSRIQTADFSPVLSADFETSIPGLHFVGLASANTFGPVMRFVFGANYTTRRLTAHLARG